MRIHAWFLTLLAAPLLACPSAHAWQNRPAGNSVRDLLHTVQARKLLANDPDLAEWNIGVIVTDRVAVLWGAAPSAEVAFRAELRLRTMIELTEVRNELMVTDTLEPMRPLKIDIPPQVLPDRTPMKLKLPADPRLMFGAPGQLTGQDKSGVKAARPEPSKTLKPAPVEVLPPQELDVPPARPRKLPVGDAQPSAKERALESAIRAVLQSKPSFRSLEFAIQGRRVYLKSSETDPEPLQEAARAISRLPHVEGVIVVDREAPR